MRIRYEVTEEIYAEAVCYQMKLNNARPLQQIRYWGLNMLFAAAAIYFFIDRTGYAMWLRLMPAAMAAVLIGFSTWRRTNLPARARGAVRRYVRSGVLDKDFLGEHTLLVEHGQIRLKAGKNWKEVPATSFGVLANMDKAALLIANGVMFDTIPLDVLGEDDNRSRLLDAIQKESGRTGAEQAG